MAKVVSIVGARPNFMKIKPIVSSLLEQSAQSVLVHTGQHYDPKLSQVFFDELALPNPDIHLNVGSGSHGVQTAAVMTAFEQVVEAEKPDAVVVVGDVNSTLACALVGAKAGVIVAHVEAGLRSRDWSMPEEVNRVVADRVSDLLLAPSPDAVENLKAEGYRDDQIKLVGNVMIDTLYSSLDRARQQPVHANLGVERGSYGLVTLHRPSNVDDEAQLTELLGALGEIAKTLPLIFPVHPRTRARIDQMNTPDGITFSDPFGYLDFLALQDGATVILTDSGGVQEESTVLGVPCLTLRNNTERPITVSEGTNTVVGTDPALIVKTAMDRINNGYPKRRPELWDGNAGARCVDAILERIENGGLRPTARR